MKKMFIPVVILILVAFTVKDSSIIGRWETKTSGGNILSAVFKPDYTYEGYLDKNMFTTGTYSFKDSILTFENDRMTQCSDTKGSYKISFLADTAIRFDVINDNCMPRNRGTNEVVLIKVKE